MNIKQLIERINSIENDYSVAFAKKIGGEFKSVSVISIPRCRECHACKLEIFF